MIFSSRLYAVKNMGWVDFFDLVINGVLNSPFSLYGSIINHRVLLTQMTPPWRQQKFCKFEVTHEKYCIQNNKKKTTGNGQILNTKVDYAAYTKLRTRRK